MCGHACMMPEKGLWQAANGLTLWFSDLRMGPASRQSMIWCRTPLGVTPDPTLAAALMSLVHTSVGGQDLHTWPLGDQLCDADLLVDEGVLYSQSRYIL